MENTAAACAETRCVYPLCLRRSDFDTDDLRHYYDELIRRAPELFVADKGACEIEMREFAPLATAGPTAGGNAPARDARPTNAPLAGPCSSVTKRISKVEQLGAALRASTTPHSGAVVEHWVVSLTR